MFIYFVAKDLLVSLMVFDLMVVLTEAEVHQRKKTVGQIFRVV